ncbi:MAG: hypothetical protein ISS44_04340, partial [Candidatus Omnitrophica bacterium]|nr:hypothetical protein [Candidatus Omnitrophota bacterium]
MSEEFLDPSLNRNRKVYPLGLGPSFNRYRKAYTSVLGYHSEWNMGSPGGWDYQRMAQEIGKFSWQRIKEQSNIDIELDFDHQILNPVPAFAKILLSAHQRNFNKQKPYIALVAEKETLQKVGENIRFIQYLNSLPDVSACLISPEKLELKDNQIFVGENRITLVFLDFNNNVIIKLKKKYNLRPLMEAIKQGIVMNPRGMEPIGAKGVFEAVTAQYRNLMNQTTLKRTPWTRQFFPRSTTDPEGRKIPDLIKWTRDNWPNIILKPVHGYSGKGIIIGYKETDVDKYIEQALKSNTYIIQRLIPLSLWAEEFPWIDRENRRLFLKSWQTDFRCFLTNQGLIGFVTRFGGIPTNVGSGGGVQSTAILLSDISVDEAIKRTNEAILNLGFDFIAGLQEEIDRKSIQMGNVYLLGPIMSTLRPRIITQDHLLNLQIYAQHLWEDAIQLEALWREGKLTKYVQINKEEEEIARLAPWGGSPALIASDGLFNF